MEKKHPISLRFSYNPRTRMAFAHSAMASKKRNVTTITITISPQDKDFSI